MKKTFTISVLSVLSVLPFARAEDLKIGFVSGSRVVAGLCPLFRSDPSRGAVPDAAISEAVRKENWEFFNNGYAIAPETVMAEWGRHEDLEGVVRTYVKNRFEPELMAENGLLSTAEAAAERSGFEALKKKGGHPSFHAWAVGDFTNRSIAPGTWCQRGSQELLGSAWRRELAKTNAKNYSEMESIFLCKDRDLAKKLLVFTHEARKADGLATLNSYEPYPWQVREQVVLPLAKKENVDFVADILFADLERIKGKRVSEWLPGVKFVSLQREAESAFVSAFEARVAAKKAFKVTKIPEETKQGAVQLAKFENFILNYKKDYDEKERNLYFVNSADPRLAERGVLTKRAFWGLCKAVIESGKLKEKPVVVFDFPFSVANSNGLPGFRMLDLTELAVAERRTFVAEKWLPQKGRGKDQWHYFGGPVEMNIYGHLNDMRFCDKEEFVSHDEQVLQNSKNLKAAIAELKNSSVYRNLRDSLRSGVGAPHKCFAEIDATLAGCFGEKYTPEMRREKVTKFVLEKKIVNNENDAKQVAEAYENEAQKRIEKAKRALAFAVANKGKVSDEELWRTAYYFEIGENISKLGGRRDSWKKLLGEVCARHAKYLDEMGVASPISKAEKAKLF